MKIQRIAGLYVGIEKLHTPDTEGNIAHLYRGTSFLEVITRALENKIK